MSSIGFTDSTNAFGPSARRLARRSARLRSRAATAGPSARLRSRATTAARVGAVIVSIKGLVPSAARARVRAVTAANGSTATLSVLPAALPARPDVLEATSSPAGVPTAGITYQ